jgi:hypothetical protein
LLGLRYLPGGQFLIKKQTVQQVIVTLPHSRGLRALQDEAWVVNFGASDKELINSSLFWQFSSLLSIF